MANQAKELKKYSYNQYSGGPQLYHAPPASSQPGGFNPPYGGPGGQNGQQGQPDYTHYQQDMPRFGKYPSCLSHSKGIT